MNEWDSFGSLSEHQQGAFLLALTECVQKAGNIPEDVWNDTQSALAAARQIHAGDPTLLPTLLHFMNDPDMMKDFAAFQERLRGDEYAVAWLDLVSYTCGFIARVTALETGYRPLPDTVLEAVPCIYKYYQRQTEKLCFSP